MIALDNLSRGRVDVVVAGGYVREEFALFDVPMDERGRRVTEAVAVLRASFAGQPFDYRGRTVHITPVPYRPGGPGIFLGGSSKPAAQRAARIADGFLPSVPEVWEYYREEVQRLGRPDPGLCPIGPNQVVALAEDPDRGWEEMAPYFLHENNAYGVWQAQADTASPFQSVADIEELRSTGQYRGAHSRGVRERAEGHTLPLCGPASDVRGYPGRTGMVERASLRVRRAPGLQVATTPAPGASRRRSCKMFTSRGRRGHVT